MSPRRRATSTSEDASLHGSRTQGEVGRRSPVPHPARRRGPPTGRTAGPVRHSPHRPPTAVRARSTVTLLVVGQTPPGTEGLPGGPPVPVRERWWDAETVQVSSIAALVHARQGV